MKTKLLLFAIFMMTMCASVYGQRKFSKVSAADFAKPVEYTDSTVDAVYIYNIGETKFSANNTSFTLDTRVKARIQILTEEGKEYANKSFLIYSNKKNTISDNDAVRDIDASVYNLVNGKVERTKMPSKYIFKEQVSDDVVRVKFTIPGVNVGSIIEYEYSISSPRCTELPSWAIQQDIPVRYSFYNLTLPEWFNYHVEERGYKTIKGKSQITRLAVSGLNTAATVDAKSYTVEAENLRPFKNEGFIYCKRDYLQRVDFELLSTNIPGTYFKNYTMTWNNVRTFLEEKGSYYKHQNISNPYSAEMASLGLDGKSVSEKASRIFALLKQKLKWDKTYALSSDNPLKAVKEGKGSNIDLNFIYIAMLRDAGISATPLLMRMRENGRLPLTYASIDKLNTFIVAFADENGSILFADCSADYGDVNILPVSLLADGVLLDQHLPIAPSAQPARGDIYNLAAIGGNTSTARIDCIIDPNGEIKGQRSYKHVGINSLVYKEAYHAREDSISMIEAKEKSLECKITSFKVKNADGTGKSADEVIRFKKDIVVDGDKLYINPLVFMDEKTNHFTQAERLLPVEFPMLQTTKITTNISIPEGYAVETIPQSQSLVMDGGHLSASISFEMKGNVLVTKYVNAVDDTFIPTDKYHELQAYWNDLLKINSMMVCLKKQ